MLPLYSQITAAIQFNQWADLTLNHIHKEMFLLNRRETNLPSYFSVYINKKINIHLNILILSLF